MRRVGLFLMAPAAVLGWLLLSPQLLTAGNLTTPTTGQSGVPASPTACCVGNAGNVDCSPGDGVDIGDLTALIDNLFISFTPLCCPEEANCDGDSFNNVDIGDLTALIDNLFISFTPLPGCTGPVDFATQVQPILTANCAVTGCHRGALPTGDLDMSSTSNSFNNLVNVVSSGYAPALRVKPFDTHASVLWNKIVGTGVYGQQMPKLGPPLPASEQKIITDWIAQGAKLTP